MLIEDFRKILLKKINQIEKKTGFDLKKDILSHDFTVIDEVDLLLQEYLSYSNRTLNNQPFKLAFSHEICHTLCASEITIEHINIFQEICHKIKNGEDVVPYQSRTLDKRFDTLYFQCGINHLHLSKEYSEKNPYLKRSSDFLVLFMGYKDTVYFVDIVKHLHGKEWFLLKYSNIAYKNWPFIYKNDILVENANEKKEYETICQRKRVFKNGIYLQKIGNNLCMPRGGGVNLGETSRFVMGETNDILRKLFDYQEKIDNPVECEKLFGRKFKKPEFKLKIDKNNELYIQELKTRKSISFPLHF